MAATYKDNGGSVNSENLEFTYDFPVLQTEDVKVSLNGVTQATNKYTATLSPAKIVFNTTSPTAGLQVQSGTYQGAPVTGVTVRVYRETTVGKDDGNEDPKAVFAAGSSIRAGDLNANIEQALFGIHELQNQPIQTEQLADGAIKTSIIDDAVINSQHYVALSIDRQHLAADIVDGTKIADSSIDSEHYVDDSIDTAHYAPNSVDTAAIGPDAVTGAELVDNAVNTEHYTDASIEHVHLKNDIIDGDNIQDDVVNSEHIAAGALDNEHYSAGSITSDKLNVATVVINSEQAAATANDTSFFTTLASDSRYFNVSTGDTIKDGDAFPDNDTTIATTAAINDRIVDLVDDVGGFVPIANETSFPNANPDVNNGTGTLVSIKALASNLVSNGSGVATIANGTVGNSTVTITGLANSTTYAATFGMIVETTTTLNTYTFHRQVPKATEVTTVAGSVSNVNTVAGSIANVNTTAGSIGNVNTTAGSISNVNTVAGSIASVNTSAANINSIANFGDQYQVSSNNPSQDGGGNSLTAGDLYYNTTANELKVYNGSAWQGGVTATGNFAAITGNNFTGDNVYSDGAEAIFGTDQDLKIHHSSNQSTIEEVNGSLNVTTNGALSFNPSGSNVVTLVGNATKGSGQMKLNCEQNSHGIILKGPPHSAAASYTLTLPNSILNNGVLKTDSNGNSSFALVAEANIADDAVTADKLANPIALPDDHKISFGTGADNNLEIFHESTSNTNEIIAADGDIHIQCDDFMLISDPSGGRAIYLDESNSRLELGFDGNHDVYFTGTGSTFATNADFGAGIDVTGNITGTGTASIGGGVLTLGTADSSSGHVNAYENMTFNIDTDNDDTNRTFKFLINGASGSGTELFKVAEDGQATLTGNLDVSSGVDVTGNITVSGTVDGRDVAADGTKLDGIDTGAKDDQTAAEIVALVAGQDIAPATVYATGNIGKDAGDYISFTTDTQMDITINGNNEFRFEADGDFHADGDVIAESTTISSDAKLKESIQVVPNALDKLEQLNGVTFNWIRSGEKSAGVIAQDVLKVLPEAVKEVKGLKDNDTHLTVNYHALTSILIESIKELKAEVEALKAGGE